MSLTSDTKALILESLDQFSGKNSRHRRTLFNGVALDPMRIIAWIVCFDLIFQQRPSDIAQKVLRIQMFWKPISCVLVCILFIQSFSMFMLIFLVKIIFLVEASVRRRVGGRPGPRPIG